MKTIKNEFTEEYNKVKEELYEWAWKDKNILDRLLDLFSLFQKQDKFDKAITMAEKAEIEFMLQQQSSLLNKDNKQWN